MRAGLQWRGHRQDVELALGLSVPQRQPGPGLCLLLYPKCLSHVSPGAGYGMCKSPKYVPSRHEWPTTPPRPRHVLPRRADPGHPELSPACISHLCHPPCSHARWPPHIPCRPRSGGFGIPRASLGQVEICPHVRDAEAAAQSGEGTAWRYPSSQRDGGLGSPMSGQEYLRRLGGPEWLELGAGGTVSEGQRSSPHM